MTRELDWNAVRADYENGMTIRQLAAKYDISKSVIGERKYKEQWQQNRTKNRTNATAQGIPNRDVNASFRVAEALKLRAKRSTYQEIAIRCGYSDASAARHAIKRELERVVADSVEEMRHEELLILDQLHEAVWDQAINKDDAAQHFAVDRALKISQARRELLGLNKPADEPVKPLVIIRETPQGWLNLPQVVEGPKV